MDTNIIVSFHIGRGGRSYNPGHKRYIGQYNISDMIERNDKHLFYTDRDKNGRFCSPCYADLNGKKIISVKEVSTGTGILDFDGHYDTYISKNIADCTEGELQLVIDSNEIWSEAYELAVGLMEGLI